MQILIAGYGNTGKHIYSEFRKLEPDIYDPNLPEYSVRQHKQYEVAFICVPTDMMGDGGCDTSRVEQSVSEINAEIIVLKSTIPPGTTDRLIIQNRDKQIVVSPEHYSTVQHCKSDLGFVIFGGDKRSCSKVAQLYYLVKNEHYKIHFTDTVTAELSKYMLNSFLALKMTFCNEFAVLAEKFNVSYPELRELFVADERVGASHTFSDKDKAYDHRGLDKDISALVKFSGNTVPLVETAYELNSYKKFR